MELHKHKTSDSPYLIYMIKTYMSDKIKLIIIKLKFKTMYNKTSLSCSSNLFNPYKLVNFNSLYFIE